MKWGNKNWKPAGRPNRQPKINQDINELLKPLSEKGFKGNVWGSVITNVQKDGVQPTPQPTPSITPTASVNPSVTPSISVSVTPTPSITPTPSVSSSPTPTPTPTPSSTPPPAPVSGTSLYLDAGNTSSYPTSGTTWTDISSNSRNFTLINGPTFSTDNGGSIVFDGINDGASRTSNTGFSLGTGDFAIEMWLKIIGDSPQNNGGIREAQLFSVFPDSGTVESSYAFYLSSNSTTTGTGLSFAGRNSGGTLQGSEIAYTFNKNELYQVGVTHVSGVTKFFVNGTTYSGSTNLTNNFTIGSRPVKIGYLNYSGFVNPLNGSIALVRFYNGVGLSDAQITQNYLSDINRI